MPDSVAAVRVVIAGQRLNYALSQAWVPLPPGITALPAAPAPVSDLVYGEVLTPTALLRPYQESIRVDCVVKVQMTQRRLEYPLTLPERTSAAVVKSKWATMSPLESVMAAKVKMPTVISPSLDGATAVALGSITYSQSSVYPGNQAASAAGMQNLTGDETTQTGTNNTHNGTVDGNWVQMDLGSKRIVNNVIVGTDYANTLAGGWGTTYTSGAELIYSEDGVNWWLAIAGTIGSFTAGIKIITGLNIAARYIRVRRTSDYVALTEFYATTSLDTRSSSIAPRSTWSTTIL
jgi:hypothetical protein